MGLFGSLILAGLVGIVPTSVTVAAPPDNAVFMDPLDTPANFIKGAIPLTDQPFMAVTRAGARLVAVGLRGLVIYSDDGGANWRQAAVPVQSDLLAVSFPGPKTGWAVGHDGVILNTIDGGESWTKQFDGRQAARWVGVYQARVTAGDQSQQTYLDEITLNTQDGPSLPWLGVWFADDHTGYAVGAFGMIARTEDGGKNWQPWLEHIQNDKYLNLNAISLINDQLYIAGEQGAVFRFDPATQRFVSYGTDYKGSFFGITGSAGSVIAFGLRGHIYQSGDQGHSWTNLQSPTQAAITAGKAFPDGTVILADEAGQLLTGNARDGGFHIAQPMAPAPATDLVENGHGNLVLVGYRNLKIVPFIPVASPTDRQ